jgi:hypothetical protein
LIAIEGIRTLKARYFRYVDTKDWPALRGLFARDAALEFPENFANPFDVDSFIAMIEPALASAVSVHHGHMPEIEILAADRARAVWAMNDYLAFPAGESGLSGAAEISGAGHYHETYVRVEGEWLIKSLRLTRLRLKSASHPRAVV